MSGGGEDGLLDFEGDESLTGFRLRRLEVLNWGTFDGRVWSLLPRGRNCLLTGDIGSGKSTLVDALTTLLVPAHRVAYNKAAGAEYKERTLRSYVLGYHRTERNESTGSARPVPLRDASAHTVLLAVFHNAGYAQTITLACVFWMKDPGGQPERFYVASERELGIAGDFAEFGGEINRLRKRLRAGGAEVFATFPPYSAWFRRRFGIESEQALDLFHQTVSMKSVGNLTDFVREHMLEPFDTGERREVLLRHFEDLDRAHEAVLKAKRQIGLLTPLVADCDHHESLRAEAGRMREDRELLTPYFASLKVVQLDRRLESLREDCGRLERRQRDASERLRAGRREEGELRRQIAENGGDRMERLEGEIRRQEEEMRRRTEKVGRYRELVGAIGEVEAGDADAFAVQNRRIVGLRAEEEAREAELQNRITEDGVEMREEQQRREELAEEIASLRQRQSNIPRGQIRIRDELCGALAMRAEEVPFIGELVQVRENERDWEGAAERLLHNFGLSLLVPDARYRAVADFVERTHLKGRLVYFRVRSVGEEGPREWHPRSLLGKLAVKPGSEFAGWVERELSQRFDFACCESTEEFRREAKALTRAGQIKTGGDRHEKDDRHRLDDRSRYVLGWSNADKIAALEARKGGVEKAVAEIAGRLAANMRAQKESKERVSRFHRLGEFRDFQEIDWGSVAVEIARLGDELAALRGASDLLQTLTGRLAEVAGEIAAAEESDKRATEALGAVREKIETAGNQRGEAALAIAGADAEALGQRTRALDAMREEALGGQAITVESCDNREREMRSWLQRQIEGKEKLVGARAQKMVAAMQRYCEAYPVETQETDASVGAAGAFREMLRGLEADDLPRFEARFKELLNQNTIREVAGFSAHLNQSRETIAERVARINRSLAEIDYNPGRYIELKADHSTDSEIREFRGDLRACTEDSLTGSEDAQYSEAKFLQVKRIVERFRGREGQSEIDRRWTRKVTDVRNWFVFSASERWREDGTEHEHYSDSGGKSGGQKEKLAYTILAASLAYQFGLEWGRRRSRTFRFVVIDEAFGRGSDESAQHGLRLFEKLNLQLLVVTPLQKIRVIEPYVSSVGFVHNEGGSSSQLRNLTIEEYREEKERHGR